MRFPALIQFPGRFPPFTFPAFAAAWSQALSKKKELVLNLKKTFKTSCQAVL